MKRKKHDTETRHIMSILKLNEPIAAKTGESQTPNPAKVADSAASEADVKRNDEHMRRHISELSTRLAEAGAISPQLLAKAAADAGKLQSEADAPKISEIVRQLRLDYPEQFRAAANDTGIDAGAGRDRQAILTPEALASMTPKEIRRLDWEAVKQALER